MASLSAQAGAEPSAPDDPVAAEPDEPGLRLAALSPASSKAFRLELGFGYSSLLVDPDVGEGYGAGLYFSYAFWKRLGAEVSFFFSNNPYDETLGEIGTAFLAGTIALGPTVRLTPEGSRFQLNADLALGAYVIVPYFVEDTWTLGVSGGLTLSVRIASWFGISLKWRYHLFNLATLAGPDLRDLKALMKVGVIDRMEIPLCLAFYF